MSQKASEPASLLDHYAGPLKDWLEQTDVNEVAVNPDGRVWIERSGASFMEPVERKLDENAIRQLAKFVATRAKVRLSSEQPIVSADVPAAGGIARIQVVTPPASAGVGTLSIRKIGIDRLGLDRMAFLDSTRRLLTGGEVDEFKDAKNRLEQGELDWPALARLAIERRWNVLFSGGTSSGKTTQANAMIAEISNQERLITIEEVRELTPAQPNVVALLADRSEKSGRTPVQLLESVLRLRPDRFIFGEIRGSDAATYLEVVNTGHPGSICTMHANTPLDAISRLSKMARRGAPNVTDEEVRADISRTIHMIVQTARHGAKRGVAGVMFPGLP